MPVEVTSPSGITLRLIPPGEGPLGLPEKEFEDVRRRWKEFGAVQAYIDNIGWSVGRHTVRLTRPLYMAKLEFGRSDDLRLAPPPINNIPSKTGDVPISLLTSLDCVKACNELSTEEGLTPYYQIAGDAVTPAGGTGYRLPTSAEWEFAFRAGTVTDFPWPVDTTSGEPSGDYSWSKQNSEKLLQVRGQKKPNAFGLHDMAGNVMEWCWDAARRYSGRVREGETVVDPQGPPSNPDRFRMLHGGSYYEIAESFPAWFRYSFAESHFVGSGFRVVRTVEQTTTGRSLVP